MSLWGDTLDQISSRDAWCRRHKRGTLSAVFVAGEILRCPRVKHRPSGRDMTCGGALGRSPSRAIVRAIMGLPIRPGTERMKRTCNSCHQDCEVLIPPSPMEFQLTG